MSAEILLSICVRFFIFPIKMQSKQRQIILWHEIQRILQNQEWKLSNRMNL